MGTSMIQWLPILLAYNGSKCLASPTAGSSLNLALKYKIIKCIFYNQLQVYHIITRHDICQKVYTTGVFGAKILPQKTRKSRQWQIYDKTA